MLPFTRILRLVYIVSEAATSTAALLQFKCVLGAFAKLRKATVNFGMSVLPYGTARLPLDVFSWNLILRYFNGT